MRVDRQVHFFDGEFVFARHCELVDQLGGVGADDVGAKNLAVLGVADDLDEAFGVARGARTTVGREGKFPDFVVDLFLLDLRLGHADRCNFRMAVGGVGNIAVVHRMNVLLAGEELGEHHAFALTFVGQHRRTGNIANGVDPFHRCLHPLVDLDEAAIGELDAQLLNADVFDDWSAAGRNENLFDFEILLLATDVDAHGDRILADLDVADFGAGQDIDLPLLEAAGELGTAVGILEWQDPGKNLNEGDLSAERGKDVGELAADRASAYDGHRLGRLLQDQRFVGRNDGGLIELKSDLRQAFHARSGRNHDCFLCLVLLFFPVDFHRNGVLAGDFSDALDPGDLVFLEEILDALRVLVADGARALHRHAVIELDITNRDAEILGGVRDFGGQRG